MEGYKYEKTRIYEKRGVPLSYLAMAQSVTTNDVNGCSVIQGAHREPGRTLRHPWQGRIVQCARGRGSLGWTDGYRAGISVSPSTLILVDLASVHLVEP